MNRWGALLLLILLTGAAALGAGPRHIIIFGDSITAGGALPAAERAKLWVLLVEKNSNGALKLINEGKGGRPTDSVKEFEAVLARQPKADELVIALGMNDSRDITTNCVPKAVANVRAMIVRARQQYGETLPVLLVGPSNINKEALGPTKPIANERDGKLRELGAGFAELAKEMKCRYFALYGVVPPTSLTKDGVHPDGAGNEAIAKALLPVLTAGK